MNDLSNTSRLPRKGLFVSASDDAIDSLEQLAVTQNLTGGEVLFEQGDDGDTMYVVEAGSLEVSVLCSTGRKLYLELMNPGDFVGEIALLDPGPRTATITAREPTQLLRITRRDLSDACTTDPELGLAVARMAGHRLRAMSQQLHEQVFLPLPARLARKLMHLLQGDERTLRLSQNDLADFIGATREAVSKTLKSWEQQGVIKLGRQKVMVTDLEALRALSGIDLL